MVNDLKFMQAPPGNSKADVEEISADGIDKVSISERQGFHDFGRESDPRGVPAKERNRLVHSATATPVSAAVVHPASAPAPTGNLDRE